MKPKPIKIRYKGADGRKREFVLERTVYLEILDLSKQESNKCVFMINLDRGNG